MDAPESPQEPSLSAVVIPLRLPIKGPSSAQISPDFGAVRDWIAEWSNQKIIPIEWRNFSHRLFGDNQMPSAAIIPDAASAVKILGTRHDWDIHQEPTPIDQIQLRTGLLGGIADSTRNPIFKNH